jgi:small subunit ribosomal protein S7
MSRRRIATKRKIQPDPLYKNEQVAKFINHVMTRGKKSVAEKIVYGAFEIITKKAKAGIEVLEVFNKALKHVSPLVEVKPRRVGGATFQVPIEVDVERGIALAMRWIRDYARKRNGRTMEEKLASEILDAADENSSTGDSTGKGGAIDMRERTHKMAAANKAFAIYGKTRG